jgi:hypothetical protein
MAGASGFTQELAEFICAEMAKGLSLRSICKADGMPAESTVRLWAVSDIGPGFAAQYARAREAQVEALGDDLLEIADDGRNDIGFTEDGVPIVNHDHIARSRLRVDSRKWLMSKIAPKRYGDKVELEHAGKIQVEAVQRSIVDPKG